MTSHLHKKEEGHHPSPLLLPQSLQSPHRHHHEEFDPKASPSLHIADKNSCSVPFPGSPQVPKHLMRLEEEEQHQHDESILEDGNDTFIEISLEEQESILESDEDDDKIVGLLCTSCQEPIGEEAEALHAIDSLFHSACFKCAQCGERLSHVFHPHGGKVYCSTHYGNLVDALRGAVFGDLVSTGSDFNHNNNNNANSNNNLASRSPLKSANASPPRRVVLECATPDSPVISIQKVSNPPEDSFSRSNSVNIIGTPHSRRHSEDSEQPNEESGHFAFVVAIPPSAFSSLELSISPDHELQPHYFVSKYDGEDLLIGDEVLTIENKPVPSDLSLLKDELVQIPLIRVCVTRLCTHAEAVQRKLASLRVETGSRKSRAPLGLRFSLLDRRRRSPSPSRNLSYADGLVPATVPPSSNSLFPCHSIERGGNKLDSIDRSQSVDSSHTLNNSTQLPRSLLPSQNMENGGMTNPQSFEESKDLQQQQPFKNDFLQGRIDQHLPHDTMSWQRRARTRLFRIEDLEIGPSVGSGFYGQVFKATHRHTGQPMVLKELHRFDKQARINFLKEVSLLRTLSHRNILQFVGVFCKNGKVNLVTEYVDKGALSTLIQDLTQPFEWAFRIRAAKDIASGMAYLHSKRIIHRDLTSNNCLVRSDNSIVVADFGLARVVFDLPPSPSENSTSPSFSRNTSKSPSTPSTVTAPEGHEDVFQNRMPSLDSYTSNDSIVVHENVGGDTPLNVQFISDQKSSDLTSVISLESNMSMSGDLHISNVVNNSSTNNSNSNNSVKTLLRPKATRKSLARRMTVVGSPYYMAPEMMKGGMYTEKVDVFSFGIIVCEMLARVYADPDILPRTSNFGVDWENLGLMVPVDCPKGYFDASYQCCDMEADNRPSFEEVEELLRDVAHGGMDTPRTRFLPLQDIEEANDEL